MTESFDDILVHAMQAAQVEGLGNPSTASGETNVHEESGESNDSLVQQHLQEESKKEAKSTHLRNVKVALLAVLTAGDSCLAVERIKNGR